MKITSGERKRVLILFIFLSIWTLVISAALVKTQVVDYSKHVSKIRKQTNRILSLHAKRGTIYDCRGEVLAISIKAKSAFINNENKQESLKLLYQINKKIKFRSNSRKNSKEYYSIKKRIKAGKNFIWIKRQLTDHEYDALKSIKKPANTRTDLSFIDEYKRIYPQQSTASHILGGVGVDEQGLAGIEYGLDTLIKGKGSKVEVLLDARKKSFKREYIKPPEPGKDIYLTIDAGIQFLVERELQEAVRVNRARGGAVVVMNSSTGSLLAMASCPYYHPDKLRDTSFKTQKNKAISFLYNPGSTFKVVLGATALESNACYPQQIFNCYNGVYKIMNETIYDEHPADRLSFEDIIIHSSNIGAARIGARLGKVSYYNGITRFGFGQRTGIRLPGDETGILRPVKEWSGVSVAYLSHGYEIMVTPLQMARAFNVLANNGFLLQPTVVKSIEGVRLNKEKPVRILSNSTCKRMTSIMTKVTEIGTGKKTRIEGIEIAGKTGTTKKMKSKTRGNNYYVSSFGGFFPAEKPLITMFVVIDEPRGSFYGGDVAAPLFKTIAQRLMIYLNIFPELDKTNEIRL